MSWQVGSREESKTGNFGTETQRRRGENFGIKKEKKEIKNIVGFVIFMISAGFTGVAHAAPGSDALAIIDMGTPTTYAFNEAGVYGRNGISGAATLFGTSVDGTRVKLFETTVGHAESLTVTYYAWPELVALSFEGTDGDGAGLSASVSLRRKGGAWRGLDAETLAALEFPFRLQPFGRPLRAIPAAELAGDDPKQAARITVAKLFVTGKAAAAVIVLALWTLTASAAAALWRSARSRRLARMLIALACATGAVAATVFALGSVPAELFAVALDANQVTVQAKSDAGVSMLIRNVTRYGSYHDVSWSLPAETQARTGSLWFMGIRSPQTAAIPVSALSVYRRLRFKTPPLVVTGPDGRAMLAAAPFMPAWGLHE